MKKGEDMLDVSSINASEVTTEGGIHLGKGSAPVKIVEFLNLKCPFCRQWWKNATPLLDSYVEEGKVERIIKLFDKEKPSLRKGNVIHRYLDYNNADKTKEDLSYFLEHQTEWGSLKEPEVAEYAVSKRNLHVQENLADAEMIIAEAEKANVQLVPTVFIDNHIFDEHISNEELKEIIETRLNRSSSNSLHGN
ncbi:thioredoxin domain-containing protein [Marinilactibacillus psychrotolerans]|uniref:thioredoxin domain-containing protein n=1 Tax=Marinilactibacillus psychrotolerans TaxID=191770 RepID=UPI00382664D0